MRVIRTFLVAIGLVAFAVLLALGALVVLGQAGLGAEPPRPAPGPHNVVLPADWETRMVRFGTVDRPERKIVRHLFVNPEALETARPGQPLPHGTLLVMADTRARTDAAGRPLLGPDGRFLPEPGWIAIAAQRKERGFGEGYGPELRNGEWEYAAFDGAGQRRNVSLAGCFACHLQARAAQDYAFGFWDFVQARR